MKTMYRIVVEINKGPIHVHSQLFDSPQDGINEILKNEAYTKILVIQEMLIENDYETDLVALRKQRLIRPGGG